MHVGTACNIASMNVFSQRGKAVGIVMITMREGTETERRKESLESIIEFEILVVDMSVSKQVFKFFLERYYMIHGASVGEMSAHHDEKLPIH